MLTYFEERRRYGRDALTRDLYRVRSWYLFGFVLLFRRWEQLTVSGHKAIPSEMR